MNGCEFVVFGVYLSGHPPAAATLNGRFRSKIPGEGMSLAEP